MRPTLYCLMISLCLSIGFSQSRKKRSSSSPARSAIAKLPDGLVQQMASDNDEVRKYLNDGEDRAKNFEARLIDVNDDRKPEYEIDNTDPASPFCFVEGNCTFWLYRKTGNGWELLLTTDVPVLPLKTSTHGYRDISVHSYVGAVHEYKTIYKFDGRRYQPKECFEWENLKVRKLVSRGPCKN
jgi:hypothetical protein